MEEHALDKYDFGKFRVPAHRHCNLQYGIKPTTIRDIMDELSENTMIEEEVEEMVDTVTDPEEVLVNKIKDTADYLIRHDEK